MINRLTTGQRLSRDLCEMDVPQGDTIEVCPIDLSSRVDAEIKSLQQQLAEAQAALVQTRDSLEAACNGLRWWMNAFPLHVTEADNEEMLKIVKALAIQPDNSALKAWLGKPVAYIDGHHNLQMGKVRIAGPLYSPKGLK